MWSLLPRQAQVLIIILAALVLISGTEAIFYWITGVQSGPWKWASGIATLIVVALTPIANWIWFKLANIWPSLQQKTFPDLNGTWTGHLVSNWINPETKDKLNPIPTAIVIRQSLLTTSVSLKTGKSRSESTRVFLERFPDVNRFRIWYSYNNDPIAQVRHRSTEHEGVAFLDVHWDEDRNRLQGRYYTARPTTGDIDVRR